MKTQDRLKDLGVESLQDTRAHLLLDYSAQESAGLISMLVRAGIRVTITPASWIVGPELTFGSITYRGVARIKEIINGLTASQSK